MTRVLIYSHDTYGLGHFRRSSLLASGVVATHAEAEVLIVTGSPRTQSFRLPDRVDTVKLPTATKDGSGRYRARKLNMDLQSLVRFRSDLISTTINNYRPDVILVDHAPLGMSRELVPALEQIGLRHKRPRLVLGLRDIIDEVGRVDAAWHRDGTWGWIDAYDEVLVYGDQRLQTTASELGLAHRSTTPVHHTGYVAPAMPGPTTGQPFLLVTAGGGGDGQAMLRAYLDAVEHGATEGLKSVVVTGPLLSPGRRAELMTRASLLPTVEIVEFTDQLRPLISSAVGVISMAGYNTVVELLAANTPALLVPRCAPRLEQHLRSARLAAVVPQLQHCPIEMLDRDRIRDFVTSRSASAVEPPTVNLAGVERSVELLLGGLCAEPSKLERSPATETKRSALMEGANHG
ncbi:MAG: glycosyltransferase family protein [Acidimicrobiales bacterium]